MSDAAVSPVHLGLPDDAEERARAEVYGLLAQLYHAAPTPELYDRLRMAATEAPSAGGFLESSWSALVAAARRVPVGHVADEFVTLFGGVGKPEVALNASWFLAGALNEKPLVALRDDLDALGLERPVAVLETEDHIAALCEVMSYLITGEDVSVSNLATQQRFFNAHLRSWCERLCETIEQQPAADFYRALAGFTRDFMAVEAQAFDLL
ncbi:molecular chaperone TorD family protein [Aquincola sp. S2]|uniref:Molecular chaperone TorD family protein n=1 Tax=Pseudaquabacterium terrae TaxID=2732868 RepID=A0ABX2EQ93_9BURK|nr:molecular chaperone TorD family protein [Aquabacterium terrae]NRF70739.1 molecular chaperone TorD family protein [Aquabacterium terrae]